MIASLVQIRQQLGVLGVSALAVLAASVSFQFLLVRPLEERTRQLDEQLQARPRDRAGGELKLIPGASHGRRIAEFYKFFDRSERIDESLGRLHGIANAAGLELRTAEYRLTESRGRFERYEISFPIHGTYGQIRLFLETALRELPELSVDRAALRRKNANEARIEADLLLTLHRLRK